MHGMPPDYTNLLARRSVEEEQDLPPAPPEGSPLVTRLFAIACVIGAIGTVTYVAISIA
jgi:hypothetical protein